MKPCLRTSLICAALALGSVASTPTPLKRLTAKRILELTAPSDVAAPNSYNVEILGLGASTLSADKLEGEIKVGKPLVFPTEFDPPQASMDPALGIVPTTPTAMGTVDTGWTVRLTANPHGKLLAVTGAAEYTSAKMLPGGYGAIAGPVFAENGNTITVNRLEQPRLETTTTRFHIFAVPGESYEVTFYKGEKAEKHTVTVTAQ